MLQTLNNNLLVTLQKKLYDTVTFDSGITLHIDPSWHPEEFSMLTATVVSVPRGVIDRFDYEGMTCDVQPGDEILMRYDVVFAYKNQPDRDTPIYKNMILYFNEETRKYEEYWLCDLQKVFAIIRDGKYIMQNGYVMCEPVEKIHSNLTTRLWTPDQAKGIVYNDRVKITAIWEPLRGNYLLDIYPGDIVHVNTGFAQKYKIDTKTFWIIKQSHILGKLP